MKAVTAGNEAAIDADLLALDAACDMGLVAVEIMQLDVFDLVVADAAGVLAALDEIAGHLGLTVDHHILAAGQFGQVDAVGVVFAGDGEAVMWKTFGMHPRTGTGSLEQLDGALLEHPCANARQDVVKTCTFENDRLDTDVVKQLAEQKAGRAGANDADLS
jgi:hypothetical protein